MTESEDKGELSLRDQIKGAMDESREPPEPKEVKEPREAKEPKETKEAKAERERGPDGKFKAKDESGVESTSTPDAAASPVPPTGAATEGETPPQQPSPSTPAPSSWSAEAKAEWAKIPPQAQKYILERETAQHRAITSQDGDRQFGKRIREITQPFLGTIESEGGTTEGAYQQFLRTAQLFRTGTPGQKTQALMALASQFQIQLPGPGQQMPQVTDADQRVAALEAKLANQEAIRKQQEEQALQSEIEAFSSDPAHSHFEEVKAIMASLLDSGVAKTLKDAYDTACWANPAIRSTLVQPVKQQVEAQAKVTKAKAAAVSINGAPGPTGPSSAGSSNKSLKDEIRAAFHAVQDG